jgi:hypothetical protein
MPVRARFLASLLPFVLSGCPGDSPSGDGGSDESTTRGGDTTTSDGGATSGQVISDQCCSVHDNPGCGEPDVAACVCAELPQCCTDAWDPVCAQSASFCGGCQIDPSDGSSSGGPGPGNCCDPGSGMGCDDPEVEACVCALDQFCCETIWDAGCAGIANAQCDAQCIEFGGDCCAANDTPGCDDRGVTDCVCALDPFCCQFNWGDECAATAQYACEQDCGLPPAGGDCCAAHEGPQCDDDAVNECVCAIDDSCCLESWTDDCIVLAVSLCDQECKGIEPTHPCCFSSDNPGCSDATVEACVCAIDNFCCDTQWDFTCVNNAENMCGVPCNPGSAGDECCTPHIGPGCNDPAVETCVCDSLPSCCTVGWSAPCVDEADTACAAMCVPPR